MSNDSRCHMTDKNLCVWQRKEYLPCVVWQHRLQRVHSAPEISDQMTCYLCENQAWPLFKPECWGNSCYNALCDVCCDLNRCGECECVMQCRAGCEYNLACKPCSWKHDVRCRDCCKNEDHDNNKGHDNNEESGDGSDDTARKRGNASDNDDDNNETQIDETSE